MEHIITETNATPALWALAKDIPNATGCICCGKLFNATTGIRIVILRKDKGYVCGASCKTSVHSH